MRAAEDKYFCINELFARFEKLDTFLKHERRFVNQCMNLKQKTSFITDWLEELQSFVSQIEQIKQKEKFLGFEPIVGKSDSFIALVILLLLTWIDAHGKLQELKKIKLVH